MQMQLDQTLLKSVLTGRKRLRYLAISTLWLMAALWFWLWWAQPDHVLNRTGFALSSLAMGWIYFLQAFFVVVFLSAKRSVAPEPLIVKYRVAMVVTKTSSEPFALLQKTLRAMLVQDYPHETWLADEDPSPETVAWCDKNGVKISTRKGVLAYHRPIWPRRTRCKEGNLAYFYDNWGYKDYDIVAQMDADHVPQPGYLRELLRPFADPAVGYVTAPSICSANAAKSWAARARLDSEAAFHGVFQSGYTGALAPMCIGSHYAVRTKALHDVGGLGPELAEDHSTTMIMNAAGWRGAHAMDAIAYGDGPATLADMVTQEFQWSRSLVTLLLTYTPYYLRKMPGRLQFQFVLCQALYPLMALTCLLIYALPIAALVFDTPFADVSYAAFLGHSLPTLAVILIFAAMMKRDGFFRPLNARVLSWEKALFLMVQWPWVAWGCLMAVCDRLTGRFVDFRITPKDSADASPLPYRLIAVYALLMLGALLPVLLLDAPKAAGFYLLSSLNGLFYAAIVVVAVLWHLRENRTLRISKHRPAWQGMAMHLATAAVASGLALTALVSHAAQGVQALTYGAPYLTITQTEYIVSGAGSGASGSARTRFRPINWQ